MGFPFPSRKYDESFYPPITSSSFTFLESHMPLIQVVIALPTLIQLKSLTTSFHSPAFSPLPSMTRLPPQSTTLLSLVSLDFHGASEYLEDFVSRIDSP